MSQWSGITRKLGAWKGASSLNSAAARLRHTSSPKPVTLLIGTSTSRRFSTPWWTTRLTTSRACESKTTRLTVPTLLPCLSTTCVPNGTSIFASSLAVLFRQRTPHERSACLQKASSDPRARSIGNSETVARAPGCPQKTFIVKFGSEPLSQEGNTMFGPGEYRSDPSAGITAPADLPQPEIVPYSRNDLRQPCPRCGHSAYRDKQSHRTLHDLGNLDVWCPRDLLVTYSQHYCTKCRKYFS